MMFYLVEEFLSLQGEGKYAGTPSYFLRTGGCNLVCPGFGACYEVGSETRSGCDTYFAVDRAFAPSWQKVGDIKLFTADLAKGFEEMGYQPHVVITGGEPLLYYADASFYRLVEWLCGRGIAVTFETNATVEIDFEAYPAYRECIFALSIKLSNSGEEHKKRIKPHAIATIVGNARESFFKFTIDKGLVETSAREEIEEIVSAHPGQEVFCMPVGECRESIRRNDRSVFEFCIKHGYRYSDRLHIRIFDKTQGV